LILTISGSFESKDNGTNTIYTFPNPISLATTTPSPITMSASANGRLQQVASLKFALGV
jgi:hypothetical protein